MDLGHIKIEYSLIDILNHNFEIALHYSVVNAY